MTGQLPGLLIFSGIFSGFQVQNRLARNREDKTAAGVNH